MKHAVIGKYGTIGILGNHDYGVNWSENNISDSITNILTKSGVTVLRNEQTEV